MKLKSALFAAALFGSIPMAQAVPFTLSECTGTGTPTCAGATTEEQLFYNQGTAGTILGAVGSQNSGVNFALSGNTPLFAEGFSQIGTGNGTLTSLTVSAPTGYVFSDLIFAIRGTGEFSVASGLNVQLGHLDPGLDTFIALATSSALFTTLTLKSLDEGIFQQIGQIRVSGLTNLNPVPLPGAVFSMGSVFAGAVGFGAARKRRRRATATALGA